MTLFTLLLACGTSTPVDAPATAPVNATARLTPDGGRIELGELLLEIPAGAVATAIDLELVPQDAPPTIGGSAYRVEPSIDLLMPATLQTPGGRPFVDNGFGGWLQPERIDRGSVVTRLRDIVVADNTDVEEVTVLAPPSAVDVLVVVDNSASMESHQARLAASFDGFADPFLGTDIDYHLGVITTDEADEGILRESGGFSWAEPGQADPAAVFADLADAGTQGSFIETGLDAVRDAVDGVGSVHNQGFLREDTTLHVVFVSDENDQSAGSPTDYDAWASSLPNRTVVSHAIVGTSNSTCSAVIDLGLRYEHVAVSSGGQTHDLCHTDWTPFLAAVGFEASGRERVYELLHPTDSPDTIEIVSIAPDGTETLWPADTWIYDPSGAIVFTNDAPAPGHRVRIRYLPE